MTSHTNNQRVIKVLDFTVPVQEDGTFYIYVIYQHDKVVLQEYPAFYYDGTPGGLPFGTVIKNEDNRTIGYVIGHHLNYYPITTMKDNLLHCGRYGLHKLVGHGGKLEYRDQEYTVEEFKKKFPRIAKQDVQCFVYA
ncbi:unnamed protein product [Acanthoscelides obtectus]|uniref:Uncharacterized protein n=1 Tax=Acanthoscelides obtectus TaxID=200917 RepID=A0A9P0JTW1_ACAOB|nr:unnamed protein product [Acanthoscelides obtectus]CAH1965369.1 unnamed protein product [Acanthoscelides obtectus]CAH2016511.1 unnamed protein product [Acanthoscelides obtectus]CAH2018820.1 unnamed protein product [Acanthoscelides obtectus]CAK1622583.1 hypothetical protein AOBTE_LOCUS1573 [Acanthoscelides obtectus]